MLKEVIIIIWKDYYIIIIKFYENKLKQYNIIIYNNIGCICNDGKKHDYSYCTYHWSDCSTVNEKSP